jgi:hypothetical protein
MGHRGEEVCRTMGTMTLWLAVALGVLAGAPPLLAQSVDPDFKPKLVGVDFTSRQVRPGDPFAMTIRFRNEGTKAARSDYFVFVHFEAPTASCTNIVISGDHPPTDPTTSWQPGQIIYDGPRVLLAPTDKPEQEYFVHVGVYDIGGTGERLLDSYEGGKITVMSKAPSADSLKPAALAPGELAKRRAALAARIPVDARASLDAPTWRFDLDRKSGAWALTDKATGVLWASDPARPRFGEVTMRGGERTVTWPINRFDEIHETADGLRLVTRPQVDGKPASVTLTFALERIAEPAGLRLGYESATSGDWKVVRVRPLADALWVTEAEEGVLYVPERLGIELPAGTGLPGARQWTTYDNLSMAMCGAVKQGSALLVNWDNVDTRLAVSSSWPDLPLVPGRRAEAITLDISAPQASCTIHPLGRGGYVEIAHAYRPLAKAKGWHRTWADKRKQFPSVDRLFGAADFKPFVFSRVVPSSRFSNGKETTYLGFTFDEAAQCAEHWRKDLGIDRAFVVLAGWINGGYDVRHPDILPAAPECGGNAGLQDAARRIKACGHLFGLHDNYQDMYQDAPSFSESWLNKDARGKPKMGGNWAGGQAWQVCAIEQVELAARPDTNLPKVAKLFGPSIYFIDTVFAWGLVTCEAPEHPMTRADDLLWKTKLCLLAKQYMGLFGSEEGREWAVPCADYQEGIFGHQADSPPGSVIPLYPLVYSDCTQLTTHQSDRIGPGDEKKVADHILFAEMQLPSFGSHLYWKQPISEGVVITPLAARVENFGNRKFEITYCWKVGETPSADYSVFVHFTHPAATRSEGIAYQGDHRPKVPTSQWQAGTVVDDGPYTVEVPKEFNGPAEVMLGMLSPEGERLPLANATSQGGRYKVGTVIAGDDGIRFEGFDPEHASELWSRGDGGWGEGLCPTDRVIKNVWEVLSPLNVITAERPLTSHEFLTPDRQLQRTRFGDVTITVAYEKPAKIGDSGVPPYGFILESPGFVAFCATRYNGVDYATPALFTARSLDGKPLAQSAKVRLFHGFGDKHIRLCGRDFQVEKEAEVSVR